MPPGTTASLLLEVADRPLRDLVHNFPLKKCNLEVNVSDRPTIGSCILAKKASTWACRRWAICLLSIFLAVLKSSKHPSRLAFLEFAISIPFNGEHPSACDKVLQFELPDVDKVEDVIVEPRLDLGRLRLDEHTGVDLELF